MQERLKANQLVKNDQQHVKAASTRSRPAVAAQPSISHKVNQYLTWLSLAALHLSQLN